MCIDNAQERITDIYTRKHEDKCAFACISVGMHLFKKEIITIYIHINMSEQVPLVFAAEICTL